MEATRRVTSVRQLELLLNYLEQHKELALGRVRSKEARAVSLRLWEECAHILNCEGPFRGAKEWTRFWNDYKSRVRAKLISLRKSQVGTGGGPSSTITLTPIEERVAVIIGRDVGPIPGVQQDPFQVMDNQEHENAEEVEPIILEYAPAQLHALDTAPNQADGQQPSTSQQDSPNQADGQQPSTSQQDSPPTESHPPMGSQPPNPANNPPNVSQTRNTSRQPARQRRARNPNARHRPTVQQSNREALEESRSAIARIEVMRARTEELLAESLLRQTEAADRHERVMERIAHSFEMVAEAINRISRRHTRRGPEFLPSDED